jgi:hypothetical protein
VVHHGEKGAAKIAPTAGTKPLLGELTNCIGANHRAKIAARYARRRCDVLARTAAIEKPAVHTALTAM